MDEPKKPERSPLARHVRRFLLRALLVVPLLILTGVGFAWFFIETLASQNPDAPAQLRPLYWNVPFTMSLMGLGILLAGELFSAALRFMRGGVEPKKPGAAS